mgnify:CR=1 FL=1
MVLAVLDHLGQDLTGNVGKRDRRLRTSICVGVGEGLGRGVGGEGKKEGQRELVLVERKSSRKRGVCGEEKTGAGV